MNKFKDKILSGDVCSCRILTLPSVNHSDMINIIRNKLISIYPGSVEDLEIDYLCEKDIVLVFYISHTDLKTLNLENPRCRFFTPYHILDGIDGKEGTYCVVVEKRIEILNYTNNCLDDYQSMKATEGNRTLLESRGAKFIDNSEISKKRPSIFRVENKIKYGYQIIIISILIFIIPQIFYYMQIESEEDYLNFLETQLQTVTEQKRVKAFTEKELIDLRREYELLTSMEPLNIYSFMSDLAIAFGENTEITSLILKSGNFQVNGSATKTLETMEQFQQNEKFHSINLNQINSISGSQRENFILTGEYVND